MEREIVVMEEGNNKVFQTTVALVLANQKAKIHSTKVKVPVSFDPSLVNARFGVLKKLVDTVKDTISKLVGAKVTIEVKRKYKLVNGNKTVKWWHVLRGDEEKMALLQKEWSKVKEQTSWSIEPCLAFEDNVLNPSSDKDPIVIHNMNTTGDGEPHKEATEIRKMVPKTIHNILL